MSSPSKPASTNGAAKPPRRFGHGLVDPAIYERVFNEDDFKTIKNLKVTKPAPKQTKPGNWKESEIIDPNKDSQNAPSTPLSPIVKPVDEKIAAAFPTGRPMGDSLDVVQCKHCKKPVLKTAAAPHIKECLRKKQEKLQKKKEAKEAKDAALRKEKGGDDEEGIEAGKTKGARKTAQGSVDESGAPGARKGKKRKADADVDKQPSAKKQKKKDEPKPKTAKPKGPVDVEKQCGVKLPNGAMCARSLTCKSHSMGAKRAVPGRSLPYDILLNQYQKKNQAKLQRAAISANAPTSDDFENAGPVDSDEEKDAIMSAISRSRPTPLVTHVQVDTRKKYQYVRMKEMLLNALGGARGAGLFATAATSAPENNANRGGMFGSDAGAPPSAGGLFGSNMGADGDAPSRRSSMAMGNGPRQILPGQLPPPAPSRKASVSSLAGASM
ncbi:SCA7-domain-containing protein [Aulographum hederae CBS 113979]|uniref:SCA7-domain-containing protein n=1 Tax=Aulographum hederae CBS 113979 TaxID=1176131 RepID=A0A6G1HD52_9PEZI|nr:SCA7-domain-containing protein [Aulographum hederae CBS 113979]